MVVIVTVSIEQYCHMHTLQGITYVLGVLNFNHTKYGMTMCCILDPGAITRPMDVNITLLKISEFYLL